MFDLLLYIGVFVCAILVSFPIDVHKIFNIFILLRVHDKHVFTHLFPWCIHFNILHNICRFGDADSRYTSDLIWEQTAKCMMTSSNGNIFRVTGPLCGEFTGPGEFPTQRPVTRSCDVFFDLRLNKRLSKQPWGWWFETPSLSLCRHCNDKHQSETISPVAPLRNVSGADHSLFHPPVTMVTHRIGFVMKKYRQVCVTSK